MSMWLFPQVSGLRPKVFKPTSGEFPGGPVVMTQRFHYCGLGSVPGQETKIPQAERYSQLNK